jgi:ABC-2 type transport system permease protein
MQAMRSIFIKEINSFFSSIVGYVSLLVFLVASGLFLWVLPDSSMLDYGYATMDRFFSWAPAFLMLLIPAITMRSFPDEFRGGTIEWLSTKPLSDLDIILGKYFASVTLVAFALLPTLIYVYTIDNLSLLEDNLDTGSIIGSYIGLLLLSSTFVAVGIFCSSLTANQIAGFLTSLFGCWLLYQGFESLSRIPQFAGGADYYLGLIGMSFHYDSISRGVIDTRDVIYFLSLIILFISLTRLSLGSRTWDTAQQG